MLFNRLFARYGAIKNIITIKNILNRMVMGIIERTIFLLLSFCSLINLEIAIGNPKEHRVINKLNVGNIREYIPIPLVVIVLVRTIFIIIPNILLINPPNINIIIDFIKLFFIIHYMNLISLLEITSKIIKCIV